MADEDTGSEQVGNQPESISEQHKSADTQNGPQPAIRVFAELPPEFIREYKAAESKAHRLQIRQYAIARSGLKVQKQIACWTFLAVAAAVAYATITQHVLEVSRQSLEALDRPWIKPKLAIASGLHFDSSGNAHIEFSYTLVNTGRSPAVNVLPQIFPRAHFPVGAEVAMGIQVMQPLVEQRRECSGISNFKGARAVFPGEEPPTPLPEMIHPVPTTFNGPGFPQEIIAEFRRSYRFLITGCVVYKYSTFPTIHQSGFIYEVKHVVDNGEQDLTIGEDVDQAHLKLVPFNADAFFAN